MKKIFSISLIIVSALFLSSCSNNDDDTPTPSNPSSTNGSASIMLEHKFGQDDFKLGTEYTTANNEKVTLSKVKYYVSNIMLIKEDNTVWEQPESYFLVDASNSMSMMLDLKDVPQGNYKGITYTIGVDSLRNVSGAQTGALDPANTMFWSWNTGYIFMKFEGTSPQSSTGSFSYHIGGFMGPNKAVTTNTINFTMKNLEVKNGSTPMVHLKTDIAQVFSGTGTQIDIASNNKTHMPGAFAKGVAQNFSQAISLDHIHN